MVIKTKTKQKILIISGMVAVFVLIAAIFYYSQQSKELASDSATEEATQSDDNKEGQDSEEDNKDQEQDERKVSYEITEFNKKDGDIFSVPDEITFNITPAVEKTKITLKDANGVVLYFEEKVISKGSFIIYPQGRLAEGSSGTLIIEGYSNNEVVTKKEVRVIF